MNRVLVVGLGSMGKRRVRLIQQVDPALKICGVDAQKERRTEAAEQFGISCCSSIGEAIAEHSPEAGFVCTSPLAHHAIIMELLGSGLHVFTEINLVSDGYEEMMALAEKSGKCLFLSSTFLYRKDVRYMIERCQGKKLNYILHTGQYLPDWHPWESYKSYFVGAVRTNGCREIMAIDLPWILAAFGSVTDVQVRKSRDSSLELDYEDSYIISMEHESGSKGVYACDLLSRKAVRSAEIFSEDLHLLWQGTPDSLMEYDIREKKAVSVKTYRESIDHQVGYASNIIENAYLEEIRQFFAQVAGTETPPYGFSDDLRTIELINRIEGRS